MAVNGEQYFFLMHRNDVVTALNIDTRTGNIVQAAKNAVPELLPLGGRMSEKDLAAWWNRRAVPSARKGLGAALRLLDLPNTQSLLVSNLALSLTDHYWIRPYESELTWEQVNLYDNEFCDSIGEFQFTNKEEELHLEGKTVFSPSASLQGELKKKWMIGPDHGRYLVKGNYGASCQQSLNEILATEIHKCQSVVPYVEYKLTTLDTDTGKSIGCTCRNFTDRNIEFIPAIDINSSEKKPNDCSEFEFFIRLCCRYGLKEEDVRRFLDYQILSDFVITNTDRHFNNFGVLRDSDTLRFIGMAPIFDSGNAMFWNVENLTETYNFLDVSTVSFKKKEVQLLSYVTDREAVDLSRLPEAAFIEELYSKDKNMSEHRKNSLIQAYQKKRGLLEEFQQGKSMTERAYLRRSKGKSSLTK